MARLDSTGGIARGFTQVPNEAICDASVPGEVRLTFVALLMFQYGSSPVRASMPRLARVVGCSEQSIRRHLRHLEQAGWIRSHSAGVGRGLVYEIRLVARLSQNSTPIIDDTGSAEPLAPTTGHPFHTRHGTPIIDQRGQSAHLLPSAQGDGYQERQGTPIIDDSPSNTSNTLSTQQPQQQLENHDAEYVQTPHLIANLEHLGLSTPAAVKILRLRGAAWIEKKLQEVADRTDVQHPGRWISAAAERGDIPPRRPGALRHPSLSDAERDQLGARRARSSQAKEHATAAPSEPSPSRPPHDFVGDHRWLAFTGALRSQLADPAYFALAQPLVPRRWGSEEIVLVAPSAFVKDMAASRIGTQMTEAVRVAFGHDVPVEIEVERKQVAG